MLLMVVLVDDDADADDDGDVGCFGCGDCGDSADGRDDDALQTSLDNFHKKVKDRMEGLILEWMITEKGIDRKDKESVRTL